MAAGDVLYEQEIGIYRLVFVEIDEERSQMKALPIAGYTVEQAEEALQRDLDALTAYNLAQLERRQEGAAGPLAGHPAAV